MMDHQNIRLTIKFVFLWLFTLVQSISAQQGFLSLGCCLQSDYKDPNTNINYIPDDQWFPDRKNCIEIIKPVANTTGNDKARVFYKDLGKICYNNLTTTKGRDYLIRATFLFSDAVKGSSFDVAVGVTEISSVSMAAMDDMVVEGMFRATEDYVDFCLITQKGDPYISKLELRSMVDTDYFEGKPDIVFNMVSRVDVGRNESNPDIRYPDDQNDRIWKPKLTLNSTTSTAPLPLSNNVTIYNATSTVPMKVLQTALTHLDKLEFIHSDLPHQDKNYTVFLYFLELDGNVKFSGQRLFDIYINDVMKYERFDILGGGSNYEQVSFDVIAHGILNLTLVKVESESAFGPLCNAYEILEMHPRLPGTNQADVNVMKSVSYELLLDNQGNEVLQSWYGDPCLPVSWIGLRCESIKDSVVITKLELMSSKLHGPIPPSITELSHLTELNLSNNGFTDKIPSPFRASSKLLSVDLSHNDLTGLIPPSLASLHQLETLYFGCNPHLSNELPSSFNGSRVTTDHGICGGQGATRRISGILIGTVACGSFVITVAVGLLCLYRRKILSQRRLGGKGFPLIKNSVFSIPSTDDVAPKSICIQTFTLDHIENATQKYKTLIGEGGFGAVYRGTLRDGQEVGVKVRSATSTQGTREFENELNLLSSIRHENLVPLLGYCCESDQQILVYPFMSNGSLQDRLYGEASKRKVLDWPTRLSIALGAARGLTYLHSYAGRCVIHRDVKSSNILLDHSMTAKMADFGFSKYAPQEGDSGASLEVRGTAGYMDPEYYSTQHLSAKSDVFSFGVVLLEIISGREPLNIHRPRNEWSLVEWAKPFIRESKIEEIVDPNIKGGYHAEAMWRVVEVALACIEPFSAYRPSMADIVRELEDAFIIENNASEYMKSIDSIGYSLGGSNRFSNRFSLVIERRAVLPPTPNLTEVSSVNSQVMAPPEPR